MIRVTGLTLEAPGVIFLLFRCIRRWRLGDFLGIRAPFGVEHANERTCFPGNSWRTKSSE
jgi:hypothetical protein